MIIFEERFFEGAWTYLIMIPCLYFVFAYYRKRLGPPPGEIDSRLTASINPSAVALQTGDLFSYKINRILVPLNGNQSSEVAFHSALKIATKFGSQITPIYIQDSNVQNDTIPEYFQNLNQQWSSDTFQITPMILRGQKNDLLVDRCENGGFDLICMSSVNMKSAQKLLHDPIAYRIVYATTPPLLFFRPSDRWISRSTAYKNMLVPLDGSEVAEQVIPYAKAWADQYKCSITLLSVPEKQGDPAHEQNLKTYLEGIKERYFDSSVEVTCEVGGSGPSRTILNYANNHSIDLIAMVSHGRGGIDRQDFVRLGSVTETVMVDSDIPLLFISAHPGKTN
ncbi:MAG: universal stress protein [Proteobacteria bacterium]|nr:universal stress protein [Pseudomonadota bacterium]